jgi:hypothetical protein
MNIPTKKQTQAYNMDKLKNNSQIVIAIKICQIIYSDCNTNKEVDSILKLVREIVKLADNTIPLQYP